MKFIQDSLQYELSKKVNNNVKFNSLLSCLHNVERSETWVLLFWRRRRTQLYKFVIISSLTWTTDARSMIFGMQLQLQSDHLSPTKILCLYPAVKIHKLFNANSIFKFVITSSLTWTTDASQWHLLSSCISINTFHSHKDFTPIPAFNVHWLVTFSMQIQCSSLWLAQVKDKMVNGILFKFYLTIEMLTLILRQFTTGETFICVNSLFKLYISHASLPLHSKQYIVFMMYGFFPDICSSFTFYVGICSWTLVNSIKCDFHRIFIT